MLIGDNLISFFKSSIILSFGYIEVFPSHFPLYVQYNVGLLSCNLKNTTQTHKISNKNIKEKSNKIFWNTKITTLFVCDYFFLKLLPNHSFCETNHFKSLKLDKICNHLSFKWYTKHIKFNSMIAMFIIIKIWKIRIFVTCANNLYIILTVCF